MSSENNELPGAIHEMPEIKEIAQSTPEQIEEYCESMDRCYREGQGKHKAVQIIRQLQKQLRETVPIDDMSGRVYPSATGPEGQ